MFCWELEAKTYLYQANNVCNFIYLYKTLDLDQDLVNATHLFKFDC